MVYCKIVSQTGSIIGAEAIDCPVFVRRQAENGAIIRCSKIKAQGIISADGSQTYQLQGAPPLPGDYLIADEITQSEYDYLIEQLDIDDDDTEPEPSPDDEDSGSDVMTPQQMRERIIALESALEEKSERISYLEEAMLDVGSYIFGDEDDY